MEDDIVETDVLTVADRLRAAREAKGMSLEDVASQTRIPLRHLQNLETGSWENLPAPTYTVGFAKSYASAVDLDRAEIGELLRAEMGGTRPAVATPAEVFEPADPARTMPKWLVLGAIAAVILLVLTMSWLNNRSLQGGDEPASNAQAEPTAPLQQPPAATPAAQQPVVLTANEQVWLSVYDNGGTSYFSGMMKPGQTFNVPGTALAPLLKTGKPEALRINVGDQVAPPIGPAGKMVSDVSLLPADLLKGGAAPPPSRPQAAPPPPIPAPPRTSAPRRKPPPPVASEPAPPPVNSASQPSATSNEVN